MFVTALLAAACLSQQNQQQPPIPLKQPESKLEEKRKLHSTDVTAMPMRIRLQAFEKRQQMLSDSIFQKIEWRNVGSEVFGGRVVDIESPMNKPEELLIAYATGGLWRTTTDGDVMEPIFDGQSSFGIGDIAVSADGQTIWVGAGESNNQRTGYSGTGVFKSTDAGKTWQHMGLPESHHIGRVLIHPKNPNVVYVASVGPMYSQGGDRGVYKTTDGGRTWEHVLEIDKYTGVIDLDIDPSNPEVLWACAYDRDRRAWNFREAGPGSGIYQSVNGGRTWKKIEALPSGVDLGRAAIEFSLSNPNILYAFTETQGQDHEEDWVDEGVPSGELTLRRLRYMTAEMVTQVEPAVLERFFRNRLPQGTSLESVLAKLKDGSMNMGGLFDLMEQRNPDLLVGRRRESEVWRSTDGGKTWQNRSGSMGTHGIYYTTKLAVHPTNPNELYTGGVIMLRSRDGGESWESIARSNHVDHHSFWIDPRNPKRMVNGNDGGPYISLDAGESWRHINGVPVGQFTTLGVDMQQPYNIYGGTQDNGTQKGPSTHVGGRSDRNNWVAIGGGDGSAIQVDPRDNGNIVYIASQFGNHSGINQETGVRWRIRPRSGRGEPALRFNWISPILISPHHPDIIYLGSQKLHRSFNQGRDFTDLSGDLTKDMPNGDVPFSTLTAIAESPFRFGQVWVGADDGSVKYTPDSGLTWEDVKTPAPERWVTRIVASQWKEGRVYVTQNGYRQDEWTPYVWRSDDYGKTWTSIAANLPFEPVNTIREDPKKDNILYVGTDMGVYVSMDSGQSWMTYGTGVPHTPVHDLVIHPRENEMVIATHARSIWVVDVEPLQTLTQDVMDEKIHMYSVSSMARGNWEMVRSAEWARTEAPDRQVSGRFWSSSKGKGRAVLIDSEGKEVASTELDVVRGFNNYAISLLLNKGEIIKPKKPTLPKTVGEALADPFANQRPEYVKAGDYKIVIEVGGEKAEIDWTLRG